MREFGEKLQYILLQKHEIRLFTYEDRDNQRKGYVVPRLSATGINITLGPHRTNKHHLTFPSVSQYQLQPQITSSCKQNSYSTFLADAIDKILLGTS